MKVLNFEPKYFRENPETKLVFRVHDPKVEIKFIKEYHNKIEVLINGFIKTYTTRGFLSEGGASSVDLFMVIPTKEEIFYCDEYIDDFGDLKESLEECVNVHCDCEFCNCSKPERVLKLVKVDGLIDFSRVEVVHTY